MAKIYPCGHVEWLLPKVGDRQWTGLFCASFERRCTALPDWLSKNMQLKKSFCISVADPPNAYSGKIAQLTASHERILRGALGGEYESVNLNLLDDVGPVNELITSACSGGSVSILLDISSMPKRIFLFAVKRLLSHPGVRDLVVCYTRPLAYKEGQLTYDAEPPVALPGFARVGQHNGRSTVIVGVGYMAFNLAELLEKQKAKSTKFLLPFPPGSPSFRRNWRLLHDLSPVLDMQTEVKRISALDMFAALNWLKSLGEIAEPNIDLIPLGPKPHALAMGLAFSHYGDSAEVIYSQPRVYHPAYSEGIQVDTVGRPAIYAYCLRRDFVDCI